MPDEAVLDSSAIAAMFLRERCFYEGIGSGCKIRLDHPGSLAIAEVGNVAWKQVAFCGEDKDLTRVALGGARVSSWRHVSSSEQRI